MYTTARVNPEISIPVIAFATAKAVVRTASAVKVVAGAVAVGSVAVYRALLVVASLLLAMLVTGHKELAACAVVVGLYVVLTACPMLLVGAGLIVLFGAVTFPRSK